MMKLYAVRDVKSEAFGAPMSIATKGLAVRSFSDACQQKTSDLNRYAEDYMLYEIGEYDPTSGAIKAYSVPLYITSAVECLSAVEAARAKREPMIPGLDRVGLEVETAAHKNQEVGK